MPRESEGEMRDDTERAELAQQKKAKRLANIERGQCAECASPRVTSRRCEYHRATHNAHEKKRREKLRASRLASLAAAAARGSCVGKGKAVLAVYSGHTFQGWMMVPYE
jgi:hypothetical protein